MQHLGHDSFESELQLDEVWLVRRMEDATRRQGVGWGQLSDRHSDFVTGVAPGALDAVLGYFVAEGVTVSDSEVEVFEEGGGTGEETEALDAAGFGLITEGADEEAAGSLSHGFRADNDGTDLGEVLTVDVECSAANELAGCRFDDGEGVDVGADLRIGAVEEGAVAGEALDQLMDGAGILQLCFARSQSCCFELVFIWEGRGVE
jgi:hypothetical protein